MYLNVDPISVHYTVKNMNEEYPVFISNLESVSSKIANMKNYWFGVRYDAVVDSWNKCVNVCNSASLTFAHVTKIMSETLEVYTQTDLNVLKTEYVIAKMIEDVQPSKLKEIQINTVRLSMDNTEIQANLNNAIEKAGYMCDLALAAKWDSSEAIPQLNNTLKELKEQILNVLNEVKKVLNENITETIVAFDKTENNVNIGKA